jgi:hypothetical protein
VICSSLVPVDRSTLCYGSDDGGRRVHDDNPTLAKKMREASELLNLAAHSCGVREMKVKLLVPRFVCFSLMSFCS